jgi:hypothetical protein
VRRLRAWRARTRARLAFALCAWVAGALPSMAQLPNASAAELGMGTRSVATARGFAAVALNPAGLGMPRTERFTVAAFPLRIGAALGPVTLWDVGEFDGRRIPDAVREVWLQRIEASGSQTALAEGSFTAAAVSSGSFGFQLSTLAVLGGELNPDAAELVLFGNAGRTGEPREFRLAGSRLDAWMVTTAAIAGALPLPTEIGDAPNQSFAVGATLQLISGNALYLARDLGSFFSGDPLEIWLRFPVVHTEPGRNLAMSGKGVALDLGFQWEADPWAMGLAVSNLVSFFSWDEDELSFRPGTALFTQDDQQDDFTPRPAADAPAGVLAEVRAFRFGPRIAAGASRDFDVGPGLRVAGQLDLALGDSSVPDPAFEVGLGAELQATPRVPVRAHAALLSGGGRLGGGVGATLGRALVSLSGSWVTPGAEAASAVMLTFSIGGS